MASIQDSWWSSAKQGRDDDLKELMPQIKDVNLQDHLGNTALHYSAAADHLQCVKILVFGKANINAMNHLGETPLHKAAWKDSVSVIEFLLQSGADVKLKNKEGPLVASKQLCPLSPLGTP